MLCLQWFQAITFLFVFFFCDFCQCLGILGGGGPFFMTYVVVFGFSAFEAHRPSRGGSKKGPVSRTPCEWALSKFSASSACSPETTIKIGVSGPHRNFLECALWVSVVCFFSKSHYF